MVLHRLCNGSLLLNAAGTIHLFTPLCSPPPLLQFSEMVLRLLSNGPEAIESVDGIDAIEAVQYGSGPPELQRMAAALVDKYYGTEAESPRVKVAA